MGCDVYTWRNLRFASEGKAKLPLEADTYFFVQDYQLAIKWFSLCRDYNPKQVECSSQLTRVFLQINRFDLAQTELEKLLKQEVQERLMLNMLHTASCGIPQLVMDVNSIRYANNLLSVGDAWFQLLMVSDTYLIFHFISFTLYLR